jgi:hypothetical protein
MQLKRYSTEELQELCTDIFYQYMSAVNNDSYECPTPAHLLHKDYEDKLKQYKDRISIYEEKLKQDLEPDVKSSLEKQLGYLTDGATHIQNSNWEYQKDLYERTESTDYARTTIRIPLDKKINSYYDDFTLEVVFYDDVCTLNGKFEEYKTVHTEKERREFIEENTEITHFGLLYLRDNRLISIISLKGKLNEGDTRVMESGVVLLSQKFSNFDALTLSDINSIDNNDLKQFIQSKIDLDKENMKELSSQNIRGDIYSIYEAPTNKGDVDLYIRYTCRGTGRVYYNKLNINNLKLSSCFKENDYDTYSKAWWDLNTLGGDINNEKPVIRC